MFAWRVSQSEPLPMGAPRAAILGGYAAFSVAAFLVFRAAAPDAWWMRSAPTIDSMRAGCNAVDYGFILAMAKFSTTQVDPSAQREMAAMAIAIILSFSVAREGAAQA